MGASEDGVVVLGAGAIGSSVAARLLLAGVPTTTVDDWPDHVEALGDGRVQLFDPEHGSRRVPAHDSSTFEAWASASAGVPVRNVILACKSADTHRYADVLRTSLSPDGVVASFQNGFNEPTIAAAVGDERTAGAIVLMDAALDGPAIVRQHRVEQQVRLGPWTSGADRATARLRDLCVRGFAVDWTDRVQDQTSGKLFRNCTLNGVCALADLSIGQLTRDEELLDAALRLAIEAARVLDAAGYRPDPTVTFGLPLGAWRDAEGPDDAMRLAFCQAYPVDFDAVPSTLQDLRSGRRTEIDFLSGWVAGEGARRGIDVRRARRLVELVHDVEHGTLDRGASARARFLSGMRALAPLDRPVEPDPMEGRP